MLCWCNSDMNIVRVTNHTDWMSETLHEIKLIADTAQVAENPTLDRLLA